MAAGYDIGLSIAASSGAQGGTAQTGDFVVGGSGGANQIPSWLWIALLVAGAIVAFKFLFNGKKR